MKLLTYALNDLPEFKQLLSAIDGGACPAAVSGLAAVHRAHFAAALGLVTGRPTVVVCPGVTIGDNCVIGAGSVVIKDIPANTVAAGSPCRVIRKVNE